MSVSVIIPQYGNAHLTSRCVNSFVAYHTDYKQILIVDDGSIPREKRLLHGLSIPRLSLITIPVNRGVTRAWNAGIEGCSGDAVILLNNDVITCSEWLSKFLYLLETQPMALCGASMRRETDLPESIERSVDDRSILQGWCLGFRKAAARQVGRFDEQFRMYFSDTDWQCRWIEKYGARSIQHVRGLPLSHSGQQSTSQLPEKLRIWRADRNAFIHKWKSRDASLTGL